MNKSISIGLWDSAFLKPYVDAFVQSDVFDVTVTSPDRCEQLALAGMIDVGLMRPHLVLLHEDDLDVYGESAISSWRFPYAQLVLDAPIGTPITSIQYCSKDQLHAIVGRIVLNEHYGFEPQFVPADTPELHGDMTGFINTDIDHGAGAGKTVLDLGQEWFELTGYPMVWGLFAVSKGSHLSSVADALNTVASTFKLSAGTDGVAVDDNDLEDFYSDEIRVGYDDLATASLTEFSHFMYFYNIVDEPVAVPVVLEDGPDLDQA